MIEIAVALPLADGALAVEARLGERATAVMGPSGAGKTSLLEAVAGLRRRARGRIVVDGETLLDDARGVCVPSERRRVGYVPQDARLFPHLTVRENVAFGQRVRASRVDTMLEVLALTRLLERHPASLSGGERQRVALARALATDPRLLLLDEPLAGLDAALRDRVLPYLLRLRAEWDVPMLYVTHQPGEALVLAEDVVVLRAGRIVQQGPPLTLLERDALGGGAPELENILPGRIVAHDAGGGVTRVGLDGGSEMTVPLAEHRTPGDSVSLMVRAEDVLVTLSAPQGISARNVFPARVVTCARTGFDVTLRCGLGNAGMSLLVRLTPAAVTSLEIHPASEVWLAIKSHSIRLT